MQKSRDFIPLIKPSVGREELEEVREVLESGWLAQGPKVRLFEKKIAEYLGARYAVATSSCTTALSLAMDALDIPQRSEVIVPDYTFPATANVVARANASPVIADVQPDIFSIIPADMMTATSKRTKAVIPVHAFGHPFEMDEVYEAAEKGGYEVIEDAATGFATKYKGSFVGRRGRAICLSFHPRKLLTTAEGGCLLTDDKSVYERARAFRNHGQVESDGKTDFIYQGLNYRMSDVHAAVGLAQLRKIDRIIDSRRKQAKVYEDLIQDCRIDAKAPVEKEWARHTYQSYVVLLGGSFPQKERCIELMRKKFNVETQVGTYSLKAQTAFRSARSTGKLRNSSLLYSRSLTLPMFESITEEQQGFVIESLAEIAKP